MEINGKSLIDGCLECEVMPPKVHEDLFDLATPSSEVVIYLDLFYILVLIAWNVSLLGKLSKIF